MVFVTTGDRRLESNQALPRMALLAGLTTFGRAFCRAGRGELPKDPVPGTN